MIVEKLLAPVVQSCGLFVSVKRTCTLPVFCDVEMMLKNMQFCSLFEQVFLNVCAALWSLVAPGHEEGNTTGLFPSILPSCVSRIA